jgi:NADPH:quinone reductase-like Zn-dependent oxidoreductase
MQAVVIDGFGGLERLRCDSVPVPDMGSWDVMLRVEAIGIGRLDCETRAGSGLGEEVQEFPAILGWDVAGTVVRAGRRVSGVDVGDAVLGLTGFPGPGGAYAEYAVVPTEHAVRVPQGLSMTEAAALPTPGLVAWQALIEAAELHPKQRVLIHGAAGGVGHLAVQIAKHRGAHVIGTGSEHNAEFLRSLGVDEFFDYREEGFLRGVPDVDVIVDPVGGESISQLLRVLSPKGVFIRVGTRERATRNGAGSLPSQRMRGLVMRPRQYQLERLTALVEEGALKPTVMPVPELVDMKHAHKLSESGHVRGRVVVRVT